MGRVLGLACRYHAGMQVPMQACIESATVHQRERLLRQRQAHAATHGTNEEQAKGRIEAKPKRRLRDAGTRFFRHGRSAARRRVGLIGSHNTHQRDGYQDA